VSLSWDSSAIIIFSWMTGWEVVLVIGAGLSPTLISRLVPPYSILHVIENV